MEGPQCEATGTRIVLSLQPGHCWIVLPTQKELVNSKSLCFPLAAWGHCVSPPRSAILTSFYPFVLAVLEMPTTTTAPARFSPDGYQSSSLGVREAVLSSTTWAPRPNPILHENFPIQLDCDIFALSFLGRQSLFHNSVTLCQVQNIFWEILTVWKKPSRIFTAVSQHPVTGRSQQPLQLCAGGSQN